MEDRPHVPPSADWPPPPPPTEPPAPPVIPWEQPGLPWTTGLVETVKLLLTRPREAFERMPIGGDVLKPFLFAILLGWIGAIFNTIWSMAFKGMMPSSGMYGGYAMPPMVLPLTALFAPVLIACVMLIASAVNHLMLMIVGGARNGFSATLRANCYSQASQVFQLLPLCGGLLAVIGSLLLTIQGLATVHRISHSKAAFAVILPFVLCCGCLMVIAATMGAAILHHMSNL